MVGAFPELEEEVKTLFSSMLTKLVKLVMLVMLVMLTKLVKKVCLCQWW